ncbi:MAG: STAS domain-containing protein [Gammaproteobacteria bacterium]|nr:STAS domain-containing protein [Gammaproteobacteria bacterium]
MTITHRKHNSIDIVMLSNRLTAADISGVRREFNNIINTGNANLLLDITELEFVDSSGLGFLVGTQQEARKRRGDMVLYNPQLNVRALLELTRLDQIFSIHSEMSEAMDALH